MNLLTILSSIIFKLIGIAGITFLIGFHELGHFLFCKLFNIKTPSFSIGFGPQLISKKIGDTVFSLSAIPLGGYVEIAGVAEAGQGEQNDAYSTDQYSFATKPYLQKLLVFIGGILFNILFAYAAIIILFATGIPKTGLMYPQNATSVVHTIKNDSSQAPSGLEVGDIVTQFTHSNTDNKQLTTPLNNDAIKLLAYIQTHPKEPITLTIQRNNNTQEITVTPNEKNIGWPVGTIGTIDAYFSPTEIPSQTLSESFIKGIQTTNLIIKKTVLGILSLFSQGSFHEMAGPLRIISMTSESAALNMKIFFLFLAIISVNLAILNLVPLPPFDGGHVLFFSIEALVGRPLPNRVREYIYIAAWIGLLALICYITFNDIKSIIAPYLGYIQHFLGW